MSFGKSRYRIGDVLVQKGVLRREDLNAALCDQERTGLPFRHCLVELGYVDEDLLLELTAQHLDLPLIDLREQVIDPDIAHLLPESLARRFSALVLEDLGEELLVGMVEPTDLFGLDELSQILARPIRLALLRESAFRCAYLDLYRSPAEGRVNESDEGESGAPMGAASNSLQDILAAALELGASDIHIDPDPIAARVRMRVDGVLREFCGEQGFEAAAFLASLKEMAGVDAAEASFPQEARCRIEVSGREIQLCLATLPLQQGESLVLRISDPVRACLDLDALGMSEEVSGRLRARLQENAGLILVVGPRGNGMRTTLHAALREVLDPARKIISVEDPIEGDLDGVCQVQVDTERGLSFPRALSAALRHDPDVVMVGAIEDVESASLLLRTGGPGLLALAGLHAIDALGAVGRLGEWVGEGSLASSALRGVLAQRLVRKLCEYCAEEASPTELESSWLRDRVGRGAEKMRFRRAAGCASCEGTGFRGRTAVFEFLELSGEVAEALRAGDFAAVSKIARDGKARFAPLWRSALECAARGVTPLSEVLRIANECERTT